MSNDKAKVTDSVDDSVLEEVSGGISIGDLGGLLSPPPPPPPQASEPVDAGPQQ